ncbi:hypothetical protein SFRURICE_001672 [Spodoptera frugiperda]|nr:hypothetical protein SFRURICE_001672 [Spodoptera frugiperda]
MCEKYAQLEYGMYRLWKPPIAHIHSTHLSPLAESVSTSDKLCVPINMIGASQTHPQQRSIEHFWCKTGQRSRGARVYDVSIVGKPSIAHIFPYKKHSLAESGSTSAKLCVPMNMIEGSQTHPQQRSIAHLWWKSTLSLLF